MTEVYEYIYSFVLTAVTAGALHVLIPEGTQKTGKFIKYIISLCVIVAIFTQVTKITDVVYAFGTEGIEGAAQGLREKYEMYAESSRNFIITDGKENAERRVAETVAAKYSVDADHVSVEVDIYDNGEMIYVRCINITLGIKAFGIESKEVEEYVSMLYGCDCKVKYK